MIPRAALDGDAMQAGIVEQVIEQVGAAAGHDAAALARRVDPVADAAMAIVPIDRMATHAADELLAQPDAEVGFEIGFVLLGDACDPDDDNDTLVDGSDNCPTQAGAASNQGCPAAATTPPATSPAPAPAKKCKKVQTSLERCGEKGYTIGRIVKGEKRVTYQ